MTAVLLVFLRYLFPVFLYIFIIFISLNLLKGLAARTEGFLKNTPLIKRLPFAQTKTKPVTFLLVLNSSDPLVETGASFLFYDDITIGRSEENDIIVSDPYVSLKHARIYARDSQYYLEDLDSLNGTFLNGIKIDGAVVVANGDRLSAGGIVFQFVRWVYEVEPGYGNRQGAPNE